ncbi:TetR/AcrR family transcriptional regulator [Mycolicibacterium pyrenivorans]|uniref:TetR/AcrR family transcriptional regulator n=1 Tax=Mycolicibacterium pyrenivorans TaxID=187102 RepID=UPI0021F32FB4|nr:TetR/AcrR family transcriptional regulator [Mycolicibacterium pyrenivorans]
MARDTRRGMIITAVQVLRERGADGLTVEEVLLRSGAPKGSVYYHFPGGRTELLDEALTYAGNTVSALLNRAATDGPESVLQEFIDIWRHVLTDSGYTAGCPVVAVAVSRTESEELADKARGFFNQWATALTNAFLAEGMSESTARQLATLSIATIEGAVVLCRAHRSITPLEDALAQLRTLINCHRFARDNFTLAP